MSNVTELVSARREGMNGCAVQRNTRCSFLQLTGRQPGNRRQEREANKQLEIKCAGSHKGRAKKFSNSFYRKQAHSLHGMLGLHASLKGDSARGLKRKTIWAWLFICMSQGHEPGCEFSCSVLVVFPAQVSDHLLGGLVKNSAYRPHGWCSNAAYVHGQE